MDGTFLDVTPVPRVLQVLGGFTFEQWKCVAELIDNSFDGFLQAYFTGSPITNPNIRVMLPSSRDNFGTLTVTDNGPGMSVEVLEHALTAGYSRGHDPSELGLFGAGLNVATAKLAAVTEIWTSRVGDSYEIGARIDLAAMSRNGSFLTQLLSRAKADLNSHGTQIVLSQLKADQRAYFAIPNSHAEIRRVLASVYSPLLRHPRVGAVTLILNDVALLPRLHCAWDQKRFVTVYGRSISAVQHIDITLPPSRFCNACGATLRNGETHCVEQCDPRSITEVPRRIHGWIGLQRYLHNKEYGIDFIRNGRKIEMGNKDLFSWRHGNSIEQEYPIDDRRNDGRIVGEIHLDHCRVNVIKDEFDRDDPAWMEMVRLIRGEGPLRPQLAKKLLFGKNDSVLQRLFSAYRRSDPKHGRWSNVLVVKDNQVAREMASRFADGHPDYQSDELWWQLVQKQDGARVGSLVEDAGENHDDTEHIFDEDATTVSGDTESNHPQPVANWIPGRRSIPELSLAYKIPGSASTFEVEAFYVEANDPGLEQGAPWALTRGGAHSSSLLFLIDSQHAIFSSPTMEPIDALLTELARRAASRLGKRVDNAFPSILADYRKTYRA